MLAVFAVAIALRLVLAWYNVESNDDHLDVIVRIVESGHTPGARDCWSCYHPTAYHHACAWLARLLGVVDARARIRLFQLVSVAAGVATLTLIRRALERRTLAAPVRLAAWALLALNPALAAINAQVTNDSFLILFATATLVPLHRFVTSGQVRWLVAGALGAALAAISKGSGLVLIVLVPTVAAVVALCGITAPASRRRIATAALAILVFFGATVPWLGSYWRNYAELGSPLALNVPRTPWPALFEESGLAFAGVSSIAESFFTFRMLDLLATPYLVPSLADYPRSRKSFWTQIYARHHFSRFAMYPPTWKTDNMWVLALARAEMVLGLLPAACLLAGVVLVVRDGWRRARTESLAAACRIGDWLFLLFAGCFLAMLVKLNLDYRYYFTMKALYLLPALLAFGELFAIGAQAAWRRLESATSLRRLAAAAVVALVVCGVADLATLAADLRIGNLGWKPPAKQITAPILAPDAPRPGGTSSQR